MKSDTTVFSARKILTFNSYASEATHVAVRDGRILAVGSLDDVAMWGSHTLDDRFDNKVLLPGFVEGHCHANEGWVWDVPYVGYHDRYDPEGVRWRGATSFDDVIEILSEVERNLEEPEALLFARGFDPIYFGNQRMNVSHLDLVSTTRPIVVRHSNGHLLNVNTVVLERAGIDRNTNVQGITRDEQGEPTGELSGMAAMYLALKTVGDPLSGRLGAPQLRRFGQATVNCGTTTATDMYATFSDDLLDLYSEVTTAPDFPTRLVPAMQTLDSPLQDGIACAKAAKERNNPKLHLGACKVLTDGSIQGFSARIKWPGYFNGAENGLWNMAPEQLSELIAEYHAAGLQLHIHANGDEATEVTLDAIESAQNAHPIADHRHTLQHCQMADESQFRRMAALGVCANMFANHIYYWGDYHRSLTMGPDRAARMDACATAERTRVHFAIHSDAPVTPLAPLFTAWCAVNRLTEGGKVLGPNERISVKSALHAITLGAAYTLKMDHLVGSIEPGKYADFAVLEDDPTDVAPEALKDVRVWGVITGGISHQAAVRSDR